jgi:DNA-binding MarR family transcriptional regulator
MSGATASLVALARLIPAPLTVRAAAAISALDAAKDGRLSFKHLAWRIEASAPVVSRLTDALESRGYVQRVCRGGGSKRRDVQITAEGRALAAQIDGALKSPPPKQSGPR